MKITDEAFQSRSAAWLVAPAVITGWLLLAAPTALATIVLGQSVAGVKLGDTKAQVHHLLGEEDGRTNTVFYYRGRGINVFFKAGRVSGFQVETNDGQKTTKGIAVGSSRAQVQAAYPQAKCEPEANVPESLYCTITTHYRGKVSYTGFKSPAPAYGVIEIEVWW